MTAVIAILNKTAVAIAADSAVTASAGLSGRKVYNTANKIFQISKYHPVGVAVYNSASLVQTPWEIVLKLYRDQLGRQEFQTVAEYRDDGEPLIVLVYNTKRQPSSQVRRMPPPNHVY